ncbi:MAG: hypothetical protein KGZ96_04385 [Clostridia bacterium]|nr:hypothetical protein [Clostridia bacterium]
MTVLWDNIFDAYFHEKELHEKLEGREEKAIYHLPQEYLELWRMPRFLEAVTGDIRRIERGAIMESWQNWHRGHSSAVAVIGYLGEGVSLFLNSLQPYFGEGQFYYLKLNRKVTGEKDLLELINIDKLHQDKARVIVIDNCHHLFLRKPGGFQALKMFLEIIAATSKNFFWITGWGRQSWIYLGNIFGFEHLFSTVVPFHKLDALELAELFLTTAASRGFQVAVKGDFFVRMAEVTGGLITPAIYYWLMCSEEQEVEPGVKQIVLQERTDIFQYQWMEELSEDEIYLLLALLQGDGLSLEQIKDFLAMDYLWCRMATGSLVKKKLAIAEKDVCLVNPLALPAVIKALTKRRSVIFTR